MRYILERDGLADKISCGSAGTAAYHSGEPADVRMIKHAKRRGYKLTSISRKVYPSQDYPDCDYILAMDKMNYRDLINLQLNADELKGKLFLMCDFRNRFHAEDVPDPYYGGADGFEQVIDILEDACEGFLAFLRERHQF